MRAVQRAGAVVVAIGADWPWFLAFAALATVMDREFGSPGYWCAIVCLSLLRGFAHARRMPRGAVRPFRRS